MKLRDRQPSRPAWLAGVLALALGSSILMPAAAPAKPSHQAACSVELNTGALTLTAGEQASLGGSVTCPIASEASEQTVTIYQHLAGVSGFTAAGTATVAADGAFQFTGEALHANSVFDARIQRSRSARVYVKVSPLVTLSGPPTGTPLYAAGHRAAAVAHSQNTLLFSGTVAPAEAGARVILQRQSQTNDENWSQLAIGEVGADGTYSISHTFTVPGALNVRVVVRAPGLLPGISAPLSYEMSRRQNPALTIAADARPLSYGEPVILSGALAGPPHQQLTLLASTAGNAFAPLATVTSGGEGAYAFPAQSPSQSTSYEVSSAHERSSTLFEGVKPTLTLAASSSSLPSAQTLTFTGTVSSTHTGQAVQLQRQNPDGLGFFNVGLGTTGAGGTYSIEHTVSGAGTQSYRIKVPGAYGMQAAASELVKVQVTHPAGAPLETEAPLEGSGEA